MIIICPYSLNAGAEGTDPALADLRDYKIKDAMKLSLLQQTADDESRAASTSELNVYLRSYNKTVTEESSMPWDGDCWFHCLSWFHDEDRTRENAKRYRLEIVQFLIDNVEEFIHFCDDGKGNLISRETYFASCKYLRNRGTYNTKSTVVGDCIPIAIAEKYALRIVVYDPKLKQPQNIGNDSAMRTLTVARITTPSCEHIQGVVPYN